MLRRLRKGEWIAVGGLVGLVVSLFLEWFGAEVTLSGDGPVARLARDGALSSEIVDRSGLSIAIETATGWGALGRPWSDVLILTVLAVLVALAMTLRAGPGRPTYGAVVSLVVAGSMTALATVLTAIRVLLARPSELVSLPGGGDVSLATTIGPGGWVGLASLVVLWIGLWVAIADDRPDAPDSAFDPPAPRPVPATVPGPVADAPASAPEA